MKSIAAYYVVLAMDGAQQDSERHGAQAAAARPSRPSLFARIRTLVASSRTSKPATSAA